MSAHQVKFVVDVDVRVDLLVQGQALHLIDGLATIVDADIEQLVADLLELLQILFFCLDELDSTHWSGRDGDDAGSG